MQEAEIDRATLRDLCSDYVGRYGITEADLPPLLTATDIDNSVKRLAESVRAYLLDLDRADMLPHEGAAADRLREMHEAVTTYYASVLAQAPYSNSTT